TYGRWAQKSRRSTVRATIAPARSRPLPSGPSTLNEDQIAERGARMARRDDREYREYLSEEQRSQPGCPAREVVLDQRGRATSSCTPGDEVLRCHRRYAAIGDILHSANAACLSTRNRFMGPSRFVAASFGSPLSTTAALLVRRHSSTQLSWVNDDYRHAA